MHTTASITGTGWPRDLARMAVVAVACCVCVLAGPLLITPATPYTPLWLPAGAALAALLLGGRGLAPSVAVGVFTGAMITREPVAAALAAAAGCSASALAATWLLGRASGFTAELRRPRDILALIGVGAFLAPVLSASLYAAGTLAAAPGSSPHAL